MSTHRAVVRFCPSEPPPKNAILMVLMLAQRIVGNSNFVTSFIANRTKNTAWLLHKNIKGALEYPSPNKVHNCVFSFLLSFFSLIVIIGVVVFATRGSAVIG